MNQSEESFGRQYMLPKAEGYFEEEGLDVDITTVQSDMPTAPVLADEAQFGLYGPEMICKLLQKVRIQNCYILVQILIHTQFFLAKRCKICCRFERNNCKWS